MSIDFNHKQDKSDQKIVFCKDQIKPQADWRAVDSPKQICFVCFFAFHGKENKSFVRFLGESTARPDCFWFYQTFSSFFC